MNPANLPVHAKTPVLSVNDSRGLIVRRVDYCRTEADEAAQTLITRQHFDPSGRLIEQWDPRLFGVAPTPNRATVYRLSGDALGVQSVDAGWRLNLPGVAGEARQRWDARGNRWQTTYDEQLRVIALQENDQPDVERFTYADATADAGHNRRGQMTEQIDPSGRVSFDSYGLGGQVLSEERLFADGAAYRSRLTFSPLGVVLEQVDAQGHQQGFGYDIAGQLKQVRLRLDPASPVQTLLTDVGYNAAGQLIEQHTGNGVVSTWGYDPANGWLTDQQAGFPGQPPLQDLRYHYDRTGDVLAIDDLVFTQVFFANQRVAGHRTFRYDSLYQLRSASGYENQTPNLTPGLPAPVTPIDAGQLYNYTQQYEYDGGGNLTTLRHVRAGNNHTLVTRIAPHSNRGVRWAEGDPLPVFDELFDAHGNLLSLQQGQPLTWNSRDQLAVARLVERSNGPDDEETYAYSQGQRVSKRLVTQAQGVSHVRQVRYLPGLEIRTLDDSEELHVINVGTVRCLHWVKGKPATIEQDQLRYGLDDHLGSTSMELDRNGALISLEIYYPFGGTAWRAARSALDADYKTLRYSGHEMDISGLDDYGARYYAPWLQRWISADPGGDVDGLNLYAMVGNNPLSYIDIDGKNRWPSVAQFNGGMDRFISSQNTARARSRQRLATGRVKTDLRKLMERQTDILEITERRVRDATSQLDTMGSGSDIALATVRRTAVLIVGKGASYGAGLAVGIGAQALGIVAPGIGNAVGVGLGLAVKTGISGLVDYVAERTGLSASVNLKTTKLTPEKIIRKAEYKQMNPDEYIAAKYRNMNLSSRNARLKLGKESTTQAAGVILKQTLGELPSEAVGAISTGVSVLVGMPEIVNEAMGASREKSDEKLDQFERSLFELAGALHSGMDSIHEMAGSISVTGVHGMDVQALQDDTGRIIGLLHGLANDVRAHRVGRKVAA